MYSATGASRRSHAKYTASRVKKSDGEDAEVPGFEKRVVVDFGSERVGDRTMWDAARREAVGSELATYVIVDLVLIAWRRANKGSESIVELIVVSEQESVVNNKSISTKNPQVTRPTHSAKRGLHNGIERPLDRRSATCTSENKLGS
jgi:hypothetical protein